MNILKNFSSQNFFFLNINIVIFFHIYLRGFQKPQKNSELFGGSCSRTLSWAFVRDSDTNGKYQFKVSMSKYKQNYFLVCVLFPIATAFLLI